MDILTIFTGILAGTLFGANNPDPNVTDTTAFARPAMETIETIDPLSAADADCQFELQLELHQFDSLLALWHQNQAHDVFFKDFIDIDTTQYVASNIPDSVYEARLKMVLSPIQMPFNHIVRSYIIAYTTSKRSLMGKVMGRSQYYFPIIEPALDRYGLPIELKMLPVIESALSPTAVSRVGATGLWQFMYGTGKRYGLEISSFIDQRRDPIASTQAACMFLKDLYDIYGDWTLALAAYNCGPGNVNKALKRAGGNSKSFWDIYPYLPRETRGYVPSFIAATYAYHFHRQHDIEPDAAPLPLATDTIMVNRVMHFDQIASTIGTPVDVIRSLNPQYKMDIIPAQGKEYSLTLPLAEVSKYLENEQQVLAKDTIYLAQYLRPSNINKNKMEFSLQSYTYKVKSGDTLSGIASKHNVKVSQLMKWNNLSNAHKLSIGQKLEIYR